ncbi:MAG: hypothetical protein UV43_C0013G0001, partial [Parcubacteria group bacterium GW2011_GWF2_42_7]
MSPNNPQSKNNSRIEPLDIVKEMK